MIKLSYWRCLVFLGLIACTQQKQENAAAIPMTALDHKQKTVQEKSCEGKDDACAEVKMVFPEFSGGKPQLCEWINSQIREQLLMYLQWGEERPATDNLEAESGKFLQEYVDYKKEFPQSSGAWFLQTESEVTLQQEGLLSLLFSNSSYTGGAHPNHAMMYLNFDLENQRLLKNEDIVLDEAKLLAMAEAAFRQYHKVDSDVSLKEDGRFFLDEGKFFLPAAMGYEGKEFVLMYNTYEITPYSMGVTELRFPLNEMEGLVRIPDKMRDPTGQ